MNGGQYDNPKMQSNPPPYSACPSPTVVSGSQPEVIHTIQPGVVHAVQPGTTVIHRNMGMVPMVIASSMGPVPASVTCKTCGQEVITSVDLNPSLKTHFLAAVLCLLGCWPCACIPYCGNTFYDADHFCPNCKAFIGSYRN